VVATASPEFALPADPPQADAMTSKADPINTARADALPNGP